MGTKTYNNYQDLITFSRASGGHALRPVSYGTELVTNGDFATDSDWTKQIGWTISGGSASCDGSGTGNSYIQQEILGARRDGTVYLIEFDVIAKTGGSDILVFFGSGSSSSISDGNSTGRKSVARLLEGTNDRLYIGCPSGNTLTIDNVSVKEVTFDEVGGRLTLFEHPDNIPRIEYALNDSKERFENIDDQILKAAVGTEPQATEFDVLVGGRKIGDITNNGDVSAFDASQYLGWLSGSLTNQTYIDYIEDVLNPYIEANLDKYILPYPEGVDRLGLLVEESRTNSVTYSEDFTQWNLSANATRTFVSDVSAPNGVQGVYKLASDGGANPYVYLTSVGVNGQHKSIWARTVSGAGSVALMSHHSVSAAEFNLTEKWQRFDIAVDVSEVGGGNFYAVDFRAGDLTEIYVWGAQLETGAFPTSYIKTTGSSATRSADVATLNTSEFGFNAKNFTILCEWDTNIPAPVQWPTYTKIFSISDADGTENVSIVGSQGYASVYGAVYTDGIHEVTYSAFQTDGNLEKTAFRVGTDTFLMANDGTLLTEDTSVNMPTLIDRMGIGLNGGNLTQHLNGYVKSIKYYPRRLTDAQLQEITS
jgi:hypothetical protein